MVTNSSSQNQGPVLELGELTGSSLSSKHFATTSFSDTDPSTTQSVVTRSTKTETSPASTPTSPPSLGALNSSPSLGAFNSNPSQAKASSETPSVIQSVPVSSSTTSSVVRPTSLPNINSSSHSTHLPLGSTSVPTVSSVTAELEPLATRPLAPYVSNQLILKFKQGITTAQVAQFQSLFGAVSSRTIKLTGAQVWKLSGAVSVEKILAQYRSNPIFEYIEPDYIRTVGAITPKATFPNDPSFNQLWGLHNTGQNGGVVDADIDAPEAWDIQKGNPNLVIGVIDTGVDYNHPDLADNIWTNPGEIAGDGIDNDSNGYIDDIRGWDFAYNDNNPSDIQGHGTHVSGTIAGKGNNGVGVTGVAWNAKIMPLKFLNDQGSGSTSNAILAIDYATAKGVKLTNNSWGGGGFSQALYDSINAAGQAGALFIAAAGNSSNNNDTNPSYPASYNLANIISVASTTRTDSLSWFSNYGLASVDLGAPGSDIYSLAPNGGYATLSGTSMASPHVAGAAALLWSQNPTWTAQQVKNTLMNTGDSIAALAGKTVSGKRLNVFNALAAANLPSVTVSVSPTSVQEDGATNLVYTFTRSNLNLSSPLTVNFGVNGTANAAPVGSDPTDYTVLTNGSVTFNPTTKLGTVTFAAGATTATVVVDPIADTVKEDSESVNLTISSGTGYIGGSPNTATGTIISEEVFTNFFSDDFATNTKGWTLGTEWQIGAAKTSTGQNYGNPDPGVDNTPTADNGVAGVVIGGNASTALHGFYYLTSPTINTSTANKLFFEYARWLNSDYTPFMQNTVDVFNGSSWINLWSTGGSPGVTDNAWAPQKFDISAYKSATTQVRFGFNVGNTGAYTVSSWNVDDVKIYGDGGSTLPVVTVVANDPNAGEPANPGQYTLTRTGSLTSPLTVNIAMSGTATNGADYTTIPTTVTFLAGSSTAVVNLNVIDDTLVEGTETATLTVLAGSGYTPGSLGNKSGSATASQGNITQSSSATVSIADNETGGTITLNAADTGWYDSTGSHNPTNTNYFAGDSPGLYRNWFTFNLPTLTAPIISAQLKVNTYDYKSPQSSETYELRDVTTAVPTLTAGGSGKTAIYADLGDGAIYGSRTYTNADDNQFRTIDLNAAAISALTAKSGQAFAFGGLLTTLDTLSNEEYVFGFSKGVVGDVQLILNTGTTLPVVTVVATDAVAGEPANPGQYTLTRTGSTTSALTVNIAMNGTATNGADYTTIPTTVTFLAGSSTAVVNLNVIDDTLVEGTETAILNVAAGAGYIVGATPSATVSIADNDPVLPVVTVVANDPNAGEPANPGQYTLTRTGSLTSALTVNIAMSGTATNGADYTTIPTTVTFLAGSSTAVVNLNVIDDTLVEGTETATLTVLAGSGYTPGSLGNKSGSATASQGNITQSSSATVSIADNDTGGTITLNAADMGWYDSTGFHSPSNTNYLSGDNNVADGKLYRNWFTFNLPTLTAPIISAQLKVKTFDYDSLQTSETYELRDVTTAVPTLTAGGSGKTAIYADLGDGAIYGSRTYTNADDNQFRTIDLNAAAISALTAKSGQAFALGGLLTTLDTIDNTEYVFGFSSPVPGDVQLILNTGTPSTPVVTLASNYSGVSENGKTHLLYNFTRSGATTNSLTVNFTLNGTATRGSDYNAYGGIFTSPTTGNIFFAPGQTTAQIELVTTGDTVKEANETIAFTLASGTGYTIGTPAAVTTTILNDDGVINQQGTTGNDAIEAGTTRNLSGRAGHDILIGSNTSDMLVGGAGNDTITSSAGFDTIAYSLASEGGDTITDFNVFQDTLQVSAAGFGGGLIAGESIAATQFVLGTVATTASHRFIFNKPTGQLFFDVDGNGSGVATLLANLTPNLNLTEDNIFAA